jgi:hypothetical protein
MDMTTIKILKKTDRKIVRARNFKTEPKWAVVERILDGRKKTDFEIIESKGKTIYIRGLRVFRDKGRIHIATPYTHTFCEAGSKMEEFFDNLLKANGR